jgi:hypothetical protein
VLLVPPVPVVQPLPVVPPVLITPPVPVEPPVAVDPPVPVDPPVLVTPPVPVVPPEPLPPVPVVIVPGSAHDSAPHRSAVMAVNRADFAKRSRDVLGAMAIGSHVLTPASLHPWAHSSHLWRAPG